MKTNQKHERQQDSENRNVKCPECGAKFEVETILRETIEKELRQQLSIEIRDRLEANIKQDIESKFAEKFKEEEERLTAKMAKEKAELRAEKNQMEEFLAEEKQKNKFLQEERAKLKKVQMELEYVKEEMEEKVEKERGNLEKAQKKLEDFQEKMEEQLSVARDEARREIKQTLKQEYQELLSREIQKAVADKTVELKEKTEIERQLKETIVELQEKLEQGSMQLQGEALELAIEETLRNLFPRDDIREIKKGRFGADLTQLVINDFGGATGKIIYESKKQKNWKDEWIQKLRQDAVNEQAEIKVIVTTAMPEQMNSFGQMEDIFICQYHELPVVATLLRQVLIQVYQEKNIQEHMKTVQEKVVGYIRSDEFITVMTMLQEAYHNFSEDLRLEEQYMKTRWKKRRDYLSDVSTGLTSLLGRLQAIAGNQLNLPEELLGINPPEFLPSEKSAKSK